MRKEKGFGKLMIAPDGKVICHICKKQFHDVAKHARQKHDISADDYRERFGLNKGQSLISQESAEKRREAVLRYPEIIKRFTENGLNTRLKKGTTLAQDNKRQQWYISQKNKKFSRKQIQMYIEMGRKLGNSGLGNRVKRYIREKTKDEKIKETKKLYNFEKQVREVLGLCINGNIENEELYLKYPKNIVDEALKRELIWLADDKNFI